MSYKSILVRRLPLATRKQMKATEDCIMAWRLKLANRPYCPHCNKQHPLGESSCQE